MAHATSFYGTVAAYNVWAAARGYAELDDATMLIRGTDYLEERYRLRWKGVRSAESQQLAWPRIQAANSTLGIIDEDGYEVDPLVVPERVELATYEAARRFNAGTDLQADLVRGGGQKLLRNKVEGAVEQEQEWFERASNRDQIPAIDGLLNGLVFPAGIVPVLRA